MRNGQVAVTLGQMTATETVTDARGEIEAATVIEIAVPVLVLVRLDGATADPESGRTDVKGAAPEDETERAHAIAEKAVAKEVAPDPEQIAPDLPPPVQHAVVPDAAIEVVATVLAKDRISAPSSATSATAAHGSETNEKHPVDGKGRGLPLHAQCRIVMNPAVVVASAVVPGALMGRRGSGPLGRRGRRRLRLTWLSRKMRDAMRDVMRDVMIGTVMSDVASGMTIDHEGMRDVMTGGMIGTGLLRLCHRRTDTSLVVGARDVAVAAETDGIVIGMTTVRRIGTGGIATGTADAIVTGTGRGIATMIVTGRGGGETGPSHRVENDGTGVVVDVVDVCICV